MTISVSEFITARLRDYTESIYSSVCILDFSSQQ